MTSLTVTHSADGIDMVLVPGNYEVVGREARNVLGLGRFAHIWFRNGEDDWELDRDL